MDDDFGTDADFTAAIASLDRPSKPKPPPPPTASNTTKNATASKIQQPTPQALPSRAAPSSILVSARQKGNPILAAIRSLPWEYSDIPSDYVLGATTCALFLSLKYHRLHPEYIYSRIRALGQKYNLRVLLTMVDIQNHEESLKELSKTSLINNLTLVLCWSSAEAGRYLELYKSFEHAPHTAIRAHQATGYTEKLVEFITVPRSVNKTDAVGLVSTFGSVRAAVNARPEEIATIAGWGEKKVQQWCGTVRDPFRVGKAKRRGLERGESAKGVLREGSPFVEAQDVHTRLGTPIPVGRGPNREASGLGQVRDGTTPDVERRPPKRMAEETPLWEPGDDEEEALFLAAADEGLPPKLGDAVQADGSHSERASTKKTKDPPKDSALSEGMRAALAKYRQE